MNATQQVSKMAAEFAVELKAVREQYSNLAQATRLAARHGMVSVEDAMAEEAKQRLRRNAWAKVTS